MDIEVKGFGALEVKDADKGEVSAIVATLNVVDRDRDVFLPGALPAEASVKMSDYKHSVVLAGAAPVGKGLVRIEGDHAVFQGQYFMGTERGREAFAMVKDIGKDGDWSFAFSSKQARTAAPTAEWRAKGARRLYTGSVVPVEVSPVLVGGGLGTGLLEAKESAALNEAKGPHRVFCDCGRCLGESPQSLVFVGKAKEVSEIKVAGPRDVRHCKSCARHAIFIPAAALTKPAA
jgi:hypothetical protein